MVTEEFTDTMIRGSIDVKEAGRLILSIPSEEGWTLYVDGKESEILDFKETFLSVYLEEGHHEIELRYMTPGLKAGAGISIVCVAAFLATMFVRNRMNHMRRVKTASLTEEAEQVGETSEKID